MDSTEQSNFCLPAGQHREALQTLSQPLVQRIWTGSTEEVEAWLDLSEAFLAAGQAEDAAGCVKKASRLSPASGRVCVAEGRLREVRMFTAFLLMLEAAHSLSFSLSVLALSGIGTWIVICGHPEDDTG
jgi:hypothetical protein